MRKLWLLHAAAPMAALILTTVVDPGPAQAQLSRRPYLQNGSSTAVTVRWRTEESTDSRVWYGTTQGALDRTVDKDSDSREHEVRLTGLAPETRYFYAVGSTSGVLAGNDAGHFFVTAPPIGAARPTRVWVLGDPGTGDSEQEEVRDAYYAFTGSRHTDLWLMLGDNAYDSGTDDEMQDHLFDVYPSMLRKSVLFPTRGNHESARSGGVAWHFRNHTMPTQGEAGGVPSGTEAYYSFDHGNIHFICLDSFGSSRSSGGAMATWLRSDLEANSQTWTIAYWHHPPYSKGSHDSDEETELIEMREHFNPILEEGGVDLVLNGHSHSYERSFFMDGHYDDSDEFDSDDHVVQEGDGRPGGDGAYRKQEAAPSAHDGAVYVVAGSSGQTEGGSLDHPAMFLSLEELGSLVLDIDGNRLQARFLRETGEVDDSFVIVKGEAAAVGGKVAARKRGVGKVGKGN
jgi:acid phosphatase type 7